MDLGIKDKPLDAVPNAVGKRERKVSYPSFDVRDEHADEIRKEQDCEMGSEGTATIKFRLTGNVQDNYSNRITFDVLTMDITSYGDKKKDEKKENEDDEEKTIGYKRPKAEKETPSTSAKDLE
jgi:hypothetical protein